jgi:ABC-type uncharacterized transport system permease subunit
VLVFGSETHRLIGEGGAAAFTQSAGFNGIVAALFGGLHPLLTIPAALLFGGMLTGGIELQRELQVPSTLIIALNGVVVVFVVASLRLRDRLDQWLARAGEQAAADRQARAAGAAAAVDAAAGDAAPGDAATGDAAGDAAAGDAAAGEAPG